ncbi:MAG: TonB-dependent receptor, partial [Bacteroidales bacterium]|nr:TonB-dependent receptor [Bacteroidales bacterium]
FSYGQGFRAPQLFDEDLHVDIAGGEQIIAARDPNLEEEKSHSFSASMDWYKRVGAVELNFMIEGFYTRLLHPFASVSKEQPDGTIIKTTINESGAKVYGTNIEARLAYSDLLDLQMGVTLQKSRYDKERKWSDDENDDVEATKKMMRNPDVYGYFVANITPVSRFSLNLSGNYTGHMLIPHEANVTLDGVEIPNSTEKVRTFFSMNFKASYAIPLYKGSTMELSAGVQNIFNAYQKDFDKGPGRASSYVYGPSLPRSYFASAKISF